MASETMGNSAIDANSGNLKSGDYRYSSTVKELQQFLTIDQIQAGYLLYGLYPLDYPKQHLKSQRLFLRVLAFFIF